MNISQIIEEFNQYIVGSYTRNPICFVRGEGSILWDIDDVEYLDFFPGFAVSGIGHCHPKLVERIIRQTKNLIHLPNTFYSLNQLRLAKKIIEHSFLGKCFFANSGAEAMEASIKCAKQWGYNQGKFKIISMLNSFHGRTLGALSATGQSKYQKGFEPLIPGFSYVSFNNFDALAQAVTSETCAIVLELIQGEGGIHVAEHEYLEKVRKLCDEKAICLIFDEVQTGMGRTGKMFAYQTTPVVPDIMALAKTLGGGVSIGAMVAKSMFANTLVPGTHASTFGGNPLACEAALAVFEIIEKENLVEKAKNTGYSLKKKLEELQLKYPQKIKVVRGVGLMLGVEMYGGAKEIVQRCLGQRLILNCTAENVIRFMPAMNVEQHQIEQALKIFEEELKN